MKLDQLTVEQLFDGIRNKDKVMLSRAVTLLESRKVEHRVKAEALLKHCLPFSGNALRVGITGVPGAGKSTFIEALGQKVVEFGRKLAVLAVDPTSQRTRGSILGDKTRMEKLSVNDEVFIRPTPAGETLGGVANSTRETIILLEAAGYDLIFIETVGVGQSEIAVHSMTDIFLLLLISGAGDELQGIKRGIIEMADIIAVNKADGDNIERSNHTRMDFKRALHLFAQAESGWTTPVESCSSITGNGLDEIWNHMLEYTSVTKQSGFFAKKREMQVLKWFDQSLQIELKQFLERETNWQNAIQEARIAVKEGVSIPSIAISKVIHSMLSKS